MNKAVVIAAIAVFSMMQFSCGRKEAVPAKPQMKTFPEQYSYMIGHMMALDIGTTLKGLNTVIDTNAFLWGLLDVMKNRPQLLTQAVLDSINREFSMIMRQAQMMKMKEVGDKNTKEGDLFLADNKTKPGVVTTASGLQYTVITEGNGPRPKATDKVKVNYRGMLLDGKEFDSSFKRGQPAVFPVNGVIPAWTEALQLMRAGSKYKLVVPPKLAYGEQGYGPNIGPNSVLVFDVELLSIEK